MHLTPSHLPPHLPSTSSLAPTPTSPSSFLPLLRSPHTLIPIHLSSSHSHLSHICPTHTSTCPSHLPLNTPLSLFTHTHTHTPDQQYKDYTKDRDEATTITQNMQSLLLTHLCLAILSVTFHTNGTNHTNGTDNLQRGGQPRRPMQGAGRHRAAQECLPSLSECRYIQRSAHMYAALDIPQCGPLRTYPRRCRV